MQNHSPSIKETFLELLALSIPQQFVGITAIPKVTEICDLLGLPIPQYFAGNLVIGDLSSAEFLLSAHLDEASFNISDVNDCNVALAPCHRFVNRRADFPIEIVGIRDGRPKIFPPTLATVVEGAISCVAEHVCLGDRAVYAGPAQAIGDFVHSKAIDDRAGAAIALHALLELKKRRIPAAVVLSDGEQNAPDGYFSRNFPHVLRFLLPSCRIVFVDGIFGEADMSDYLLCREALLVPHTGSGKGYTVPPLLFARLRDEILPAAKRAGVFADVCSLYHSRGDDWGLVTNPTSGQENEAFFVSFYGWGRTPAKRSICIGSLESCVTLVSFACDSLYNR